MAYTVGRRVFYRFLICKLKKIQRMPILYIDRNVYFFYK